MTHNKVEVLEHEEASGLPGIGVLGSSHPLKGCVVGDQGELPAKEVVAQLQDCPFDGQGLLFHRSVIPLGRGQLSQVCQGSLPTHPLMSHCANRTRMTLRGGECDECPEAHQRLIKAFDQSVSLGVVDGGPQLLHPQQPAEVSH